MKRHRLFLIFLLLAIIPATIIAQNTLRIEPPNWWTDMREPGVQLMVYGESIGEYTVAIQYPGVEIESIEKATSPNYLFIGMKINPGVTPGTINIQFNHKTKQTISFPYPLYQRDGESADRSGIGCSDVIYLLMPDRFANGDPANDELPGMLEKKNRNNPDGRHGGDIRGIRDNLDYFSRLGVSAVWINPLLENNMQSYSYHGYAITDFYRIDPRFGSNNEYKILCTEAHKSGLKIIMDMVFNHCGGNHRWMNDLPFQDWIHSFPNYTPSNYRAESLMDLYAAATDRELMSNGWFDRTMPDLNQKNPFVANYLIQNSIWWVEFAGLDGIRMDTYPYSDQGFMKRWIDRISQEYPNFRVIKEAWLQTVPHTAYFEDNPPVYSSYHRTSHAFTDFPLNSAINNAFHEQDGWTTGVSRLYYVLSQDFLYAAPLYAVTFADNHDISRFYSTQHEDLAKWKMGIAFLMTTRGIPMIYYGTENLMTGFKDRGDAQLRNDFPGGWPGDTVNVFKGTGLSSDQKEAYAFLQKLLQIRKENSSLQTGALKHFAPEHGVYVYFRYDNDETIMVIINNDDRDVKSLNTGRFNEMLKGKTGLTDLMTGRQITLEDSIMINPKSVLILQLH